MRTCIRSPTSTSPLLFSHTPSVRCQKKHGCCITIIDWAVLSRRYSYRQLLRAFSGCCLWLASLLLRGGAFNACICSHNYVCVCVCVCEYIYDLNECLAVTLLETQHCAYTQIHTTIHYITHPSQSPTWSRLAKSLIPHSRSRSSLLSGEVGAHVHAH